MQFKSLLYQHKTHTHTHTHNTAQNKFESDVLFGGKFSTSGLGSSVSSNFERTAMRR